MPKWICLDCAARKLGYASFREMALWLYVRGGVSWAKIALRLGVHSATVRAWAHREGIKDRHGWGGPRKRGDR